MKSVHTIPPDAAFLDDLAAGLAKLLQLKSHAGGEVWGFGFSFGRHEHASLAKYRQLQQV